jgi:hypothetical protein
MLDIINYIHTIKNMSFKEGFRNFLGLDPKPGQVVIKTEKEMPKGEAVIMAELKRSIISYGEARKGIRLDDGASESRHKDENILIFEEDNIKKHFKTLIELKVQEANPKDEKSLEDLLENIYMPIFDILSNSLGKNLFIEEDVKFPPALKEQYLKEREGRISAIEDDAHAILEPVIMDLERNYKEKYKTAAY